MDKKTRKKLIMIQFMIFIVVLFFIGYYLFLNYLTYQYISAESISSVPYLKKIIDKNPDAVINQTFINGSITDIAILDILDKCGIDVAKKDYVLVEITANGTVVRAYFDPITQKPICIYEQDGSAVFVDEESDTSSGGGGSGGGGDDGGSQPQSTCSEMGGIICEQGYSCSVSVVPSSDGTCCLGVCNPVEEDECQTGTECDDSNPLTTDTCEGSPKACVNILMGCSEAGFVECSASQACTTGFVSAADTDRCCEGSCFTDYSDLCDDDNDCTTSNPTLEGRCIDTGVRKECRWYPSGICSAGDDFCPTGCTIEDDPDCT